MIVYIDAAFRCSATAGEGLTAVEASVFDGKCSTWINGMRYVPAGQTWTRADGTTFSGEMLSPVMDVQVLAAAQAEYEAAQATIAELDAAVLELSYQNVIGGLEA